MEAPRQEPERERFQPRLVEQEERRPAGLALRRDVTRWGPIFAGFVSTIATAAVLSVLGAALGLSAIGAAGGGTISTAAAIWGGIVLLVSFFVGGYVAARTCAPGGPLYAVVNSAMVWATSLVVSILLTAIGLGSIVGLLGTSVPSMFGATAGVTSSATATLWAAFIGMIVALAAAIVGGLVGMHREVEPYDTY